jgi:hypothetical protein
MRACTPGQNSPAEGLTGACIMTAYKRLQTPQTITEAARAAKAKRQAVLERVRKQRAQTYKRTVAEWMDEGVLIPASELKKRYQHMP